MRLATAPVWMVLALLACACSDGRRASAPPPVGPAGKARLQVGAVPVEVSLAMTRAERAQGLSNVASLGADEGMLFVYGDEQRRQFWMRDCLLALDIAFLDVAGRVLHVDTLQPPSAADGSIPRTRRSAPSAYVLELRAGFFERHGLGAGTQVEIPVEVRREDAD